MARLEYGARRRYPLWMERVGRLFLVLGLALSTVGGATALVGSAQAVTTEGRTYGTLVSWAPSEAVWAGTYDTPDGEAFCVTPAGEIPYGDGPDDLATLTAWTNGQGDQMTQAQLNQAAWISNWYVQQGSTDANAAIARMAMLTVLGYDHSGLDGSPNTDYNFDVFADGSRGQLIADQLGILPDTQALVTQARQYANSWDGATVQETSNAATVTQPGEQLTDSVTFPGIPAGYAVDFYVTAPDQPDHSIGSVTTDGTGTATATYTVSTPGQYSIRWEFNGVAPSLPVGYTGAGANPQYLFMALPSRSLASPQPIQFQVLQPAPTLGTHASGTTLAAGDTLTDTVVLGNLTTALDYTIDGTLSGPVPANNGSCAGIDWTGAPAATTFSYDVKATDIHADGSATIPNLGPWQVPGLMVDQCVSYGELLTAKNPDGTIDTTVAYPVGDPDETVLLTPSTAVVTSQVSATASLPGQVITDAGTVTNVVLTDPTSVTYTWTWQGTLYGPVAPGAAWTNAPVAKQWTTPITAAMVGPDRTASLTGMGSFSLPVEQLAGCYSYAADVTIVGSDGSTSTIHHPVGDPAQTTCAPLGEVTVGTGINDPTPMAGTVVSDTVKATGVVPSVNGQPITWTLEGKLYGPVAPDASGSCLFADWSTAPVVNEYTYSLQDSDYRPDATFEISGLGEYTLPANQPAACWTYGERLTGVSADGSTSMSAGDSPGAIDQIASVANSQIGITSTAHLQQAVAGDTASDSWSLTNLIPTYEGSPVTWRIDVTWYKAAPVSGACDQVDWTRSTPAMTGSHTLTTAEIQADLSAKVSGVGTWVVPPYSDTACYSAAGTLTGTTPAGWTMSVNHEAGDAAQTVLVNRHEITVATQTSAQTAAPGQTITDAVHATGVVGQVSGQPVTWVVTGDVWQTTPDANGSCASADWTHATSADEFSVLVPPSDIKADGTVALPAIGSYQIPLLQPAMCLSYAETLTGTWPDGTVTTDHPRGETAQTTTVSSGLPTVTTAISSQSVRPGDTISDSVTIAGLVSQVDGSDITWDIHGILVRVDPKNPNDPGTSADPCEGVDWTKGTVVHEWDTPIPADAVDPTSLTLPGLGQYTVPVNQPAQCLSYGETLTGTWTGAPIMGAPSPTQPGGSVGQPGTGAAQLNTVVVKHEAGMNIQATVVASGIVPVSAVQSGGTILTTNPWAMAVLLTGLLLTGMGVIMLWVRRRLPAYL
ncbi:MAG: hypothetical protein FWF43_01355 [Propionibacteriaceae bacterium]|nr:hypothetical protein [Propionibacteriaceae bacterium]